MAEHIALSLILFFALGAVAGIFSGLLGIGGGVIIVPGLAWLFSIYHFPAVMQMAAATSLAVMVVSMLRALIAHRRYYVEYWSIYRRWITPLIVGVLSGVIFAHFLQGQVIRLVFGVFVLLSALRMFISPPEQTARYLPGNLLMTAFGYFIGVVSGLLGVGGGSLTIPFLTHFNVSMRRSVVVSIAVSLTIALAGSFFVIITGMQSETLPPRTLGYIYWPAWLGVAMGSLVFVPIGARLSHRLPIQALRKILAFVLVVIGVHLLLHYKS